MKLTESVLQTALARHRQSCDACDDEPCDQAKDIEASFWNEVDSQIDEYEMRRSQRG